MKLTESAAPRTPEPRSGRQLTWLSFGVLMLGGLIGTVLILPYAFSLVGPLPAGGPPLAVVIVAQVIQTLVLIAIAVAIGLWLGPRVGLGAPLLRRWLAGDPQAPREYRATVGESVVAGVLAAVAILALSALVFAPLIPAALTQADQIRTTPLQGFLASFYGGIVEELLFRLGVMTFLVWAGARVTGQKVPSAALVWSASVLTALLFGAGHLPAVSLITALTPAVVVRTLVLNGVGGVVFGWLYWRRGILSAITAHFAADIVLHVLAPLFL